MAAASAALVACNKTSEVISTPVPYAQKEISMMSFASEQTKGYVVDVDFYDTEKDKLHDGSDPTTPRVMLMSAYLYAQNGLDGTYFENVKYAKSDDKWHATPAPVYWPVGARGLDFLAISAKTDLGEMAVPEDPGFTPSLVWNKQNVAASLTMKTKNEFKQDDIVFSSVSNRNVSSGATVNMEFKHAQAWIEFQLKSNVDDVITIRNIELQDAYDYENANLTVMNNNGNAIASWSFRESVRKNVLMDDTYTVYNTALKITPADASKQVLDMLIPEQPMTSFLITYTLAGNDKELTYRYDLPHSNFLMGQKYIYAINFSINEITVDPKVLPFGAGHAGTPETIS